MVATLQQILAAQPVLATVSGVSASSGSSYGGTAVTITGTFFKEGVLGVTFGGVAATSVVVVSDTSITCTTAALSNPGTGGTASVVVKTEAGNSAANSLFTFVVPAPTVSSVSASSGVANGGTSVTITGTHFIGATGVTFGGNAATSVSVVNATTITCTTPWYKTGGAVSVLVTTAGGSNGANSDFTYNVTPGNVTYSTYGPGNYTVQPYNTLTIDLWGAGGSGGSPNNTSVQNGNVGGTSTVGSPFNMTALGGLGGWSGGEAGQAGAGGAGQATSGANSIADNGNSGNPGVATGNSCTAGAGGSAPGGGGSGGAGLSNGLTAAAGNPGLPSGGGGGGARGVYVSFSSTVVCGGGGGASGSYCRSVYTGGTYAGNTVSWVNGQGGPSATGTLTGQSGDATAASGAGADGTVSFTVS